MGHKVQEVGGAPLTTVSQTASSDAVQTLPSSVLELTTTNSPKDFPAFHCVITVEDAPIRFAFKADPVIGGLGKRVDPGQEIHLNSYSQIVQFRYRNDIAGSNNTIQIQSEV